MKQLLQSCKKKKKKQRRRRKITTARYVHRITLHNMNYLDYRFKLNALEIGSVFVTENLSNKRKK